MAMMFDNVISKGAGAMTPQQLLYLVEHQDEARRVLERFQAGGGTREKMIADAQEKQRIAGELLAEVEAREAAVEKREAAVSAREERLTRAHADALAATGQALAALDALDAQGANMGKHAADLTA